MDSILFEYSVAVCLILAIQRIIKLNMSQINSKLLTTKLISSPKLVANKKNTEVVVKIYYVYSLEEKCVPFTVAPEGMYASVFQ